MCSKKFYVKLFSIYTLGDKYLEGKGQWVMLKGKEIFLYN